MVVIGGNQQHVAKKKETKMKFRLMQWKLILLLVFGLGVVGEAQVRGSASERQLYKSEFFATYRKDQYLPYSEYPEAGIPSPVNGGRLHVVGRCKESGTWSTISVNGV